MEQLSSEFGRGFVYNLFLFAKHWWRMFGYLESYKGIGLGEKSAVSLWFNGAADHFFELEVPPQYKDTNIGKLAEELRDLGLQYRLDEEPTKEDFDNFFKKCEELMMLIDESLGVISVKADYN